jgi:hypothetical protein
MAGKDCVEFLCVEDKVFAVEVNSLLTAFILPDDKAMIIAADVPSNIEGLVDAQHHGVWLNEKQLYALCDLVESGELEKLLGRACLSGQRRTQFLDPGNHIVTDVICSFHAQFGRRLQFYQHQRNEATIPGLRKKTVSMGYRAFCSLYQELDRLVFKAEK